MAMSSVSLYERVLGDATDERLRGWAINAAIAGFLLHVLACTLHQFTSFDVPDMNGFFDSYLDALYTPFSIILAYEVYELIRAIPESFSISIGKQFEVMSLLVVRDMFKNLADVEKASGSAVDGDVALIALEAVAFLVLFTTALYFRRVTLMANTTMTPMRAWRALFSRRRPWRAAWPACTCCWRCIPSHRGR